MNRLHIIKAALVTLALPLAVTACGSGDEKQAENQGTIEKAPEPKGEMTVAQMIASADIEGYVEPDDISVKRIEYLTKRLSQATVPRRRESGTSSCTASLNCEISTAKTSK